MRTTGIGKETIVVAGTTTRLLHVDGAGPVAILVHGFTDSADTWHGVLGELADAGRAAVAVDLPGHGTADPLPGEYDTAALDQFVLELVELVVRRYGHDVVLVGNSLGAALVLRHAATVDSSSGSVAAVVAISAPYRALHPGLRALPWLGPAVARLLGTLRPDRLAGSVLTALYMRLAVGTTTDSNTHERYRDHLGRERIIGMIGLGTRVIGELPSTRAVVDSAFGVPTTVWWGRKDRICPPPREPVIHHSTRVILDAGGVHCPQLINPSAVAELILDSTSGAARRRQSQAHAERH